MAKLPNLPRPLPLSPRSCELIALQERGYIIGKNIGLGSYATVHHTEFRDATTGQRMHLACKIIDKDRIPRDFLDKFFPRELEILTKIENPHIIQVHSILQRGPRVFIFMRYADNGDLLDYVQRYGPVPEPQCKVWFRQMTSGLQYLHSKNIAHRDLKCENILLSRRFNVKLADFGFARYCVDSEGRRVLSQTYCGSAAYAAPEVVSSTPYNPKLADVWSLGIILFIMLDGSMPFDDDNHKKLLRDQLNRNWAFCDITSLSAINLVRCLLEPDAMSRLSLERAAAHEWLCSPEAGAGAGRGTWWLRRHRRRRRPRRPMTTKLVPRASEVYALEQQGYYIGKKIGEGSYASVHVANYVHRNKTKIKRIACKILDKEKAAPDFLEHFFPRELDILTKVESPYIIQVYSIYERGPRVFIFMSLAENGDLLDYVTNRGEVPESRAKVWFSQICRGTEYLHGKDIAHRDLKCENVLLSRNFNCKLTDFGFARYCNNLGSSSLCETFCGSAAYAAPEVVGGMPYNPKMADVWSLGVILFAMLNASMPFNDANRRQLVSDQMSGNWQFTSRVEYSVSAVAKSLVAKILEPSAASRLSLKEILDHDWLRACKEQVNVTAPSTENVEPPKEVKSVPATSAAHAHRLQRTDRAPPAADQDGPTLVAKCQMRRVEDQL